MRHDHDQADGEHADQHDNDREHEPARIAAPQPKARRHDRDLSSIGHATMAWHDNLEKASRRRYPAIAVTRPASRASPPEPSRRAHFQPAKP
jgi:hypothetical protein